MGKMGIEKENVAKAIFVWREKRRTSLFRTTMKGKSREAKRKISRSAHLYAICQYKCTRMRTALLIYRVACSILPFRYTFGPSRVDWVISTKRARHRENTSNQVYIEALPFLFFFISLYILLLFYTIFSRFDVLLFFFSGGKHYLCFYFSLLLSLPLPNREIPSISDYFPVFFFWSLKWGDTKDDRITSD